MPLFGRVARETSRRRFNASREPLFGRFQVYYYSLNAAAKKGMNLSAVFGVVHGANMAKRNPATGKFEKRESDGKIIKPPGWSPPDVEGELKRQLAEGSF